MEVILEDSDSPETTTGQIVEPKSEANSRKSSAVKFPEHQQKSEPNSRKSSSVTANDGSVPAAGRKVGVFGAPPSGTHQPPSILNRAGDRKVSHENRKISIEDRKLSTVSNNNEKKTGGRPLDPENRKISRVDSTLSQGGRKIGVLKRTLTQMTLSHMEIGSLGTGGAFEDFTPKKGPQILAALAATVGAVGMGTVMAYTSTANPQIEVLSKFGPPDASDLSWVASLVPMAAIFAGAPTGQAIERIGRKTTMILLSLPFVLGWLLIAFAVNIPMMLVGRFLSGFCAGAFSLTAPVFISETAEDSIRGTLGSGFQLMVTIGILFSYVVGAFVSYVWLAVISASVPVIMVCLMTYVPASPRWLAGRGQMEEASKALAWFRGADSSQQVEEELRIIQHSIDESKAKKVKSMDYFSPAMIKPMAISVGLMFFQSFSGTDAITFYTVNIFEDAGSNLDGNVATIIVGTVQVLATFASLMLVDRAGRRILLLASDAVMALSLACLAVFFFLSEEDRTNFGWLPLVSLIVFVSAYSIGFGPIPWMMMGEILPNHVIGIASAIATSFNWFFTFLVIRFFEDLQTAFGQNWLYLFFSGWCVLGLLFVFFFVMVPETRGKSLDEIQELFVSKKSGSLESKSPPPSRRVSRTTVDSLFFG